jgi:hypothetical protein
VRWEISAEMCITLRILSQESAELVRFEVKQPRKSLGRTWAELAEKRGESEQKATNSISRNSAKLLTFLWWIWFCFVRIFSPGSTPGRGIVVTKIP